MFVTGSSDKLVQFVLSLDLTCIEEQRLAVWQIPKIWSEHRKSMLELVAATATVGISESPDRKLNLSQTFKEWFHNILFFQYVMCKN